MSAMIKITRMGDTGKKKADDYNIMAFRELLDIL